MTKNDQPDFKEEAASFGKSLIKSFFHGFGTLIISALVGVVIGAVAGGGVALFYGLPLMLCVIIGGAIGGMLVLGIAAL